MATVDGPRPAPATVGRKADHIRINLEEDVAAKGVTSGFEDYRFVPRALPEIDLDEVSLETDLFGYHLQAPILISCMTGGTAEAEKINRTLAQVAQERRFALGLGSARVLLEHPEVFSSFNVRPDAPDVPLLANIGAVQLNRGVTADDCRRLVDLLGADALVLHLNALQEALQPEGDTTFGGLLRKIEILCHALGAPVIAKEVGWGIPPDAVGQLLEAGVSAVDVAGAGGTSWSEVERHRLGSETRQRVAAAFAGWGLPTAEAVREAHQAHPDALIFASGGIKSGMDASKAIALGAHVAGIAGPFLRAAAAGVDAGLNLAEEHVEVLRTVMFGIGAASLAELRDTPRLMSNRPPPITVISHTLAYTTQETCEFIDITDDVLGVVAATGVRNGIVHVHSNHTTAAIRINENEPYLITDFQRTLRRLIPEESFEHDVMERRPNVPPDEPHNGRSHCQHLLLSSSESLPIRNTQMQLGPWQRIFLIELDSSRQRHVTVQVVGH